MTAELFALDGPDHIIHPAAVMTAHHGRNDAMIAHVARLYIPDGATVIDATWGRGNFWPRTDTGRFRLIRSDLAEATGAHLRADFRQLPFGAAAADAVVLDPPYVARPDPGRFIDKRYRNSATTRGLFWREIMDLYHAGMTEAARVLRPGGTCWVKCQDTIENRCQRWSVIKMHEMALSLRLVPADLFILVNPTPPGGTRAERQSHARRNHSYLWIFAKPRTARAA